MVDAFQDVNASRFAILSGPLDHWMNPLMLILSSRAWGFA
ncbi:hypothetical protein SATRM34S_02908 [Streptomyces atroolivaceus]